MKKSYVLVYTDQIGAQEEVKNVLNNMPSIKKWRYDMPNAFYVVSERSASDIAKQFESHLDYETGRFIILEYTENSQGRLTEKSWSLLNEKE